MSLMRARDRWTWVGIGVVAVAAAVMSFSALRRLAVRADVSPSLAWLLPVAIDSAIVVATRVWLIGGAGQRVTRYARFLALSALALSVAGNATEHAMAAYAVVAPWWVLVAVSAVPPVALGATVHLAALLAGDTRAAATATHQSTSATASRAASRPATRATPASAATPKPVPKAITADNVKRTGDKEAAMRAIFDRYRAEGRLHELAGAELARGTGAAQSLGRRYRKKWMDELDDTASDDGEERAA